MKKFRTAFVCAIFLALTHAAFAHDPGLSGATVRLGDDRIDAVVSFSRTDIDALQAAEGEKPLETIAAEAFAVSRHGKNLPPSDVTVRTDDQNNVEFRLAFPNRGDDPVTVESPLIGRLAAGHRQYLTVTDAEGQKLSGELLSAAVDSAEIAPPAGAGEGPADEAPAGFLGFVVLGIEHIVTGWDHLLFLGVLLVVAGSFRDALKIITCFTLAHSITLALATFDVVSIPPRIVEPLIAASIVYVAIENLVRGGEPRGRWLLTMAFGLVHGLGFASVLRDLGIADGSRSVWLPLFGFNLGVEIGQIAVASIVLPLLLRLRAHPVWVRRWVPVCSALIALMGGYWFVERVWFG